MSPTVYVPRRKKIVPERLLCFVHEFERVALHACIELRDKLANLFRDKNDLERFAIDAQLDLARINLDGSPVNAWASLMTGAWEQRKLSSLFARLAIEDSSLSTLLSEVASESDTLGEYIQVPIDLSTLQIDDSEVVKLSSSFLVALNELPQKFVSFVLSDSAVTVNKIDELLEGFQTAHAKEKAYQYQQKANHNLWQLKQQQTKISSGVKKIWSEINRISTCPPEEPRKPREPLVWSTDGVFSENVIIANQNRANRESYLADLVAYGRAMEMHKDDLETFNQEQARRVTLEAELYRRERDSDQIANQIATFELELQHRHEEDAKAIDAARGLDLMDCISTMMDEASSLLSRGQSLNGFAFMLLAVNLNAKFQRVHPSASSPLIELFERKIVAIERIAKNQMETIARTWLVSIPELQRALQSSRIAEIAKILGGIPEADLNRKLWELRQLCDTPLPVVRLLAEVMTPMERSEVAQLYRDSVQALSKNIDIITDELGVHGQRLANEVDTAFAKIEQIHCALGADKVGLSPLACQAYVMLIFASKASTSALLDGWLKDFCDSMIVEAERRLDFRFQNLPASAYRGYLDVRDLENRHLAAEYRRLRELVRSKLTECENGRRYFEVANNELANQPLRQLASVTKRLWFVVARSWIPVLNVIDSFTIAREITGLTEVLKSNHPADIELGKRGKRCLAVAMLISVTLLAVCVGLIWRMQYVANSADGLETLFSLLVLIYGWNTLKSIFNLCRWFSYTHKTSAAAGEK